MELIFFDFQITAHVFFFYSIRLMLNHSIILDGLWTTLDKPIRNWYLEFCTYTHNLRVYLYTFRPIGQLNNDEQPFLEPVFIIVVWTYNRLRMEQLNYYEYVTRAQQQQQISANGIAPKR